MKNANKRLTVLSDLEEFAFYGFPDFNDEQRLTYFIFDDKEWELITTCPTPLAQVACALQTGYFKAKHAFFPLHHVPKADLEFILSHYFPYQAADSLNITKHEYYLQREAICQFFGYKLWSKKFMPLLKKHIKISVKRDLSPSFIAQEALDFLQDQHIVRPGYSTLQKIISLALTQEKTLLKSCLGTFLTDAHKEQLKQLLKNDQLFSSLSALKQDPKNFKISMMRQEIKKHDTLKPLQTIAQDILPRLSLFQQNITYYASLILHYTTYELAERLDDEQTYLYLLCYILQRYQQVNDNLIEAFLFLLKDLERKTKILPVVTQQDMANEETIGKLLLLYVDDKSKTKDLRKKAFTILPKESIRTLGEKMIKKPKLRQEFQWQERDKATMQYKQHLRPLLMKIDFTSQLPDNPLLKALQWMKSVFANKQTLTQQPFEDFPTACISKRIESYLTAKDDKKNPTINANRFEIQVYRQVIKQMETGALYVKDSIRHRPFAHDLVSLEDKKGILKTLRISWLETPCKKQLNKLVKELESLWIEFDYKLKHDQIKHLKYDPVKKEITWVKPRIKSEDDLPEKHTFYDEMPLVDIADVLRFVQEKTKFLSVFKPLQPLYKKQDLDEDTLIAALIARATGIGNYKMAQASDASCYTLDSCSQQYLHLPNLRKGGDIIADEIRQLSIFPHHIFDLYQLLYGAVDGQKFEAMTPTTKARNSKKYFKKGKGVVAYTLLSNHIPLQSELIGPHEHESYFMFDIWYNNTSCLKPFVLTGDMHSVNKGNFAIFSWFGADFRPNLKNLKRELKNIYGTKESSHYKNFLVQPAGKLNKQVVLSEKSNIDQIVATLALKEISQSTLIKKLCSLPSGNKTRQAVFEYNKLIRSIYTLKCILNPQMLIDVNPSQNRIESYHTLRSAIAKVGGRKALLGRTDLDMEISNQCGLIIAKAIIYYNDYMLSGFLDRNLQKRILKKLKKVSPIAWHHLHFTGHFTFYDHKRKINIDEIIENIKL